MSLVVPLVVGLAIAAVKNPWIYLTGDSYEDIPQAQAAADAGAR